MASKLASKFNVPEHLSRILSETEILVPESRKHLYEMVWNGSKEDVIDIGYDVPGKGHVIEANVTRCKNGAVVNYTDIYMRRRDPDCMVVADEADTDKTRYTERFGGDFEPLRQDTFNWLIAQKKLIVVPFYAGGKDLGYPALLVSPANAGFFANGLADLQGFVPAIEIPDGFTPKAIIYLAPPFRHTHFEGKQIVVHNRTSEMHELFSYNLYPGPSAKKGVYGVLLTIGEQEGWITLHGSSVRVITPYENEFTIMHEGASGSGKSEMLENIHREGDGRVLISENLLTHEKFLIEMGDTCDLRPITDDMALCHPKLQNDSKKLVVIDAEAGWFLRVDHLKSYGTEPSLEKQTIHPKEPLVFLNIQAQPNATALIWEHTMDSPGKPCPNPRVILPRSFIEGIINDPVEIDMRSFGVRTPPSTREKPSYGIIGMFHILPPALGWLWRLVAPRGHANPSIVTTEGLTSEGVGSYWPFATGKMVTQANLLLEQIVSTPLTRYTLIPNQHIGAYKVGFKAEWIAREYLSRRGGAKFRPDQIEAARNPLLGYLPSSIKINGVFMPRHLLAVNEQHEVGNDGYDAGAKILSDFFKSELAQFNTPEMCDLGRKIIDICMRDGSLQEYMDAVTV